MTATEIIAALGLKPHPEGGHYVETYRHAPADGGRGAMTAIYFLLAQGEVSRWHRVDAAEIWHWYAGAPLTLGISSDGARVQRIALGPDIAAGQRPQAIVPPGHWQAAESRGAWTLAGCTVGPAFAFDRFELAPAAFALDAAHLRA